MKQDATQPDRIIQTVTGPVRASELGFCQCHEHLFIRKGMPWQVNPALWIDDPSSSESELLLYRSSGGQALVDAQPVGCGRMACQLRDASERTGVCIVASTGFHKLQFYDQDHWIHRWDEDALTRLFTHEITVNMYSDGDDAIPSLPARCRAGIIKTALDEGGLTDPYRKLFGAAAEASLATGAPLLIHTEKSSSVLDAIEFMSARGVPSKRLIFCHMDRTCADRSFHEQVAREGAFLEYDTIGRFKYHSDEEEIALIQHIIKAGLAGQVLLSLDTTRQRLKSYGATIGLDYILKTFIPTLKDSGVSSEDIDSMTMQNPVEALSLDKPINRRN